MRKGKNRRERKGKRIKREKNKFGEVRLLTGSREKH